MGCALNQLFIQVQKLVLLPLKVRAGMWALVVIGKEITVFVNQKNRLVFALDFNIETSASRVFDVSSFAKKEAHSVLE